MPTTIQPSPPGAVSPTFPVVSLSTGHFDQYAGYSGFRPKGTPDWLLIYTVNGLGRAGYEPRHNRSQKEVILTPGDMILLRPGTFHDYGVESTLNHWELLWTHFLPRAEWLNWLNWREVAPGLHLLRPPDDESRTRVERRFADVHRHASGARLRREALAMNALEELLLICDEVNPNAQPQTIDARIRSAMDLMARRVDEPVTIEELADVASLSPSRFAHLFREQTGTTPQRFMESRRIDRAVTLLRMTQLSIKEIAAKVGYASPFYFTLRFKKLTGKSPRAYRRSLVTSP